MRIPLTKYGLPQAAVFPAALIAVMIAVAVFVDIMWLFYCAEVVLAIVLLWVLAFFRDPVRSRATDADVNVLTAPADGKITDIEVVQEDTFIHGRALRIGIFLSIFNVHINRMPCAAVVEKIVYRPGKYKNAMNPASARVNESNDIMLTRPGRGDDKLIVRQISGAIARRIVCLAKQGQKFSGGQQFGMIKFGSRTELYIPAERNIDCLVKIGDKVRAGTTVMARYQ